MKKIKTAFQAFVLASLTSGVIVHAENNGINYNYAGLKFINYDINGVDGDGLRFEGSYQQSNDYYFIASFDDIDFDSNQDASLLSFGGGIIIPQKEMDAFGEIQIVRSEVESDSDTGFHLAGGARGYIKPEIEVSASLNYINLDDSDTYLEFGANFFVDTQFSVGGEITLGGDADVLGFGGRYYF